MSRTITPKGFAEWLNVSRSTLHRMGKADELPESIKTGRRVVRWLESDIALWLDLGCPSASEFKAAKRDKARFARSKR